MKQSIIIVFSLLFLFACADQKKSDQSRETATQETEAGEAEKIVAENIYQFKVEDLYGDAFDFSTLKGKKIMVVNTASKCGLTPQYKDLQKLYDTYKDSGFVIVGFPANNFSEQEPGTNEEIAEFCEQNYGVSFPMMSKISVKGNDMHPLYQFLTEKNKNGYTDSEVEWNFQKYLINPNGELEKVISPKTLPTDASVISWLEKK